MKHRAISSFYCMSFVLIWVAGVSRLAAEDSGFVPKSAEIAILRDPGTPSVGAKVATVTLVEYFDYNCSFCKKLAPALQGLLASDPKVVIIYKDWPILGEMSKYAAGLALAAGWQGKYLVAHDALMNASRLASSAQVDALLRGAGIEMQQLLQDRQTHTVQIAELLRRNDTEAHALGMRGTPGLLVGRHIINGVYDVPGLQLAVAIARRDGPT
jgi:protein-disulfide isomerase